MSLRKSSGEAAVGLIPRNEVKAAASILIAATFSSETALTNSARFTGTERGASTPRRTESRCTSTTVTTIPSPMTIFSPIRRLKTSTPITLPENRSNVMLRPPPRENRCEFPQDSTLHAEEPNPGSGMGRKQRKPERYGELAEKLLNLIIFIANLPYNSR